MVLSRALTGVYVCLIATILCLIQPVSSSIGDDNNTVLSQGKRGFMLQSRETPLPALRVMPLGASITVGYRSTDGNGYRGWLREDLVSDGWQVDMVGSQHNGSMEDNDHEGHFGYRIDQITSVVEKSLDLQPNLILLNAGTNDALQQYDIDSAGDRMSALLTRLFDAIPGTTVILSTLLPCKAQPGLTEQINDEYRALEARRRADGDRVVLADMGRFIRADQITGDGIHPTDAGYKDMAWVWLVAIKSAEQAGMIQKAGVERHNAVAELVSTSGGQGVSPRCLFSLAVLLQLACWVIYFIV